MRRFIISALLACALQVFATTIAYKSFDDLVKEADGIVIGTVMSIEAHRDGQGLIYTYVTLGDLELLYGRYNQKQLTLRLEGGRVGDEILYVVGSPVFQQKERVILFVKGNGSKIVPLVGWGQGMFRVQKNPVSNQEVISDSDGNRVFAVQSGHVMKEQRLASPAEFADLHSANRQDNPLSSKLYEAGFSQTEKGEMVQPLDHQMAGNGQSPIRLQDFVAEIQTRAKQRQAALTPLASVTIGDQVEARKDVEVRLRSVEATSAIQ